MKLSLSQIKTILHCCPSHCGISPLVVVNLFPRNMGSGVIWVWVEFNWVIFILPYYDNSQAGLHCASLSGGSPCGYSSPPAARPAITACQATAARPASAFHLACTALPRPVAALPASALRLSPASPYGLLVSLPRPPVTALHLTWRRPGLTCGGDGIAKQRLACLAALPSASLH